MKAGSLLWNGEVWGTVDRNNLQVACWQMTPFFRKTLCMPVEISWELLSVESVSCERRQRRDTKEAASLDRPWGVVCTGIPALGPGITRSGGLKAGLPWCQAEFLTLAPGASAQEDQERASLIWAPLSSQDGLHQSQEEGSFGGFRVTADRRQKPGRPAGERPQGGCGDWRKGGDLTARSTGSGERSRNTTVMFTAML